MPLAAATRASACVIAYVVGSKLHAHTPRCPRQTVVLGRKRQSAPHRKFEIAGIVSAQAFFAGQIEHGAEGEARRLLVDHDRQAADQGNELARPRRHDPLVALADRKRVGQLQMPQRGDLGMVLFEPVQQRPGLRSTLVVKAPGEGDGGVDDKAAQRLPSLINP